MPSRVKMYLEPVRLVHFHHRTKVALAQRTVGQVAVENDRIENLVQRLLSSK